MDILCDIGRVLLDFDFKPSLRQLIPEHCSNPEERLDRLLEKKDEFETGAISTEAYTQWALETLGTHASHSDFHAAWQHIFTPNLPMWEKIKTWSLAGHRLILFSNINSIHCPWIFEHFPQFDLFNHAVLSYQVGAIKPQPSIYEYAIQTFQLDPPSTIYIDDLEANITTGTHFGFQCWQYDIEHHHAFEAWAQRFHL